MINGRNSLRITFCFVFFFEGLFMASLSQVAQVEFDNMVKEEYRSNGFILKDKVRTATGVIGNSYQFRTRGQIIATQTGFSDVVPTTDPGFRPVIANLAKWMAGDYIDDIEQLEVNFDTRLYTARAVNQAIGRRSDQIIINSLSAAVLPPAQQIAANASSTGANANLTMYKLRQALKVLDDNAVPETDRFLICTGNNQATLLKDDHFTSRFFTYNDAMARGSLNGREVLGLNVVTIPNNTEGGLPKVGNNRTIFIFHRDALGMAMGQDLTVKIDWVPQVYSWLVAGAYWAGSVAIDTRGIVSIVCDETVDTIDA